jgi:hypothetical protein
MAVAAQADNTFSLPLVCHRRPAEPLPATLSRLETCLRSFHDQSTLVLGEGASHLHEQSTRGRTSVDRIVDASEVDPGCFQLAQGAKEMMQGASEPIELRDGDHVEPVAMGVRHQLVEGRASVFPAGDALVEVLANDLEAPVTRVNYSCRSTPTTSAAVVDSPGLKREGVSTGGVLHFRLLVLLARRPWVAGLFASAWASAVR